MARSLLVASALILLSSSALFAQYTLAQQKRACRGDAMRLCWKYVPNRAAITSCLAANHDQLSPGCMQVFDAGMKNQGQ